jgi:hypothetical protein
MYWENVNKLFFVGALAGFGVVIANVVGQIRRPLQISRTAC